jgi:hypothetical protein
MRIAKEKLFVLSMLGLLFTSFASADIKVNDASSDPVICLNAPATVRVNEDFTGSIKVTDAVNLWGYRSIFKS